MKGIQHVNAIVDVRFGRDLHNLLINRVDIKDLRFPISLKSKENEQSTVVRLIMTVFLPVDQKGTYISHLATLMERQTDVLDLDTLHGLTVGMVALLDPHSGKISMPFPFFRRRNASVSDIWSLLDYDIAPTDETKGGTYSHSLKVMVPVTSLYPCPKEISQYGAHNQRSHITVSLITNTDVGIEEIIDYVEAQVGRQLYDLLKRPDEKYVTEKTYGNPEFAEDIVRDAAAVSITDERTKSFVVGSENFESIRNHSAYAYIAYP